MQTSSVTPVRKAQSFTTSSTTAHSPIKFASNAERLRRCELYCQLMRSCACRDCPLSVCDDACARNCESNFLRVFAFSPPLPIAALRANKLNKAISTHTWTARVTAFEKETTRRNPVSSPRFDDWFSVEARRRRQNSIGVRATGKQAIVQTSSKIVRIRPNDWFSVEARLLRKRRPPSIYLTYSQRYLRDRYHSFPPIQLPNVYSEITIPSDVINSLVTKLEESSKLSHSPHPDGFQNSVWAERQPSLDSSFSTNNDKHAKSVTWKSPKQSSEQVNRRRPASSQPQKMKHSKSAHTKFCSSVDVASWFRGEAKRLALTSDEAVAAQSKSRNRAAAGLLWVVLSAAGATSSSGEPGALATEDLVQEGSFALLTALERWNPNKGVKLSSYAYLCAKYAMRRAVDKYSRTIRLPVHVQEKLRRIYAVQHRLQFLLNEKPTLAQVAAAVGYTPHETSQLLRHARHVSSIDVQLEFSGASLKDILEDPKSSVANTVEGHFMLENLARLVREHECLSDRERNVLILRYGLQTGVSCLLKDVARQLDISRYKVRTAEKRAIAKMRQVLSGYDRDAYQEWLSTL